MSITLLYCEGDVKSPDVRTLGHILNGAGCRVQPIGGKYGFGQRVRITQELRVAECAGLRDRDFDADETAPTHQLRDWRVEGGQRWLGWTWERHEIENYLLDPHVVQAALGMSPPNLEQYQQCLHTAALSIAAYTAARYALSLARVRFAPLPNDWGRPRGRDGHPFPDKRAVPQCRAAIASVVAQHEAGQQVSPATVLAHFETLLPTCEPGGVRFAHFLTFFAGKDLYYALEPALQQTFGFHSAMEFRERILRGMVQAQQVWDWLPEWTDLRTRVSH